jgi:uncharacterized membrane protein YfcA
LIGLDLFSLIVTVTSVFVAGIIRGYSGFGFAMVAVTSISLVLPPAHVVPIVLILEVLASIRLVPQVWKDIDWYGWAWKRMPGRSLILTTGVACGILNGAAAIGGPPVILLYLSSPAGVTVSRASIIAYFLGIDAMSLAMASIQGLTTSNTLLMTAICLLPLLIGIAVGSRMFIKIDKDSFRHVLILLIILSIAGLLRGIII